jgi:large subunit ribosomal protein L19
MDIIAQLNKESMEARNASIPEFAAGDTLRVHVKVKEGDKSRVQIFEGLCIARHNNNIGSSFTVRKISFGEGVERVFPLYSPVLEKIELVRRGEVRRAKLYYLRGLTGKAARIAEKARKLVPAAGSAETAKTAAPVDADKTEGANA